MMIMTTLTIVGSVRVMVMIMGMMKMVIMYVYVISASWILFGTTMTIKEENMTMKLYKCDICGQEICSMPDKLIFTNIKKCYWVFATYKEETLDVCLDCQRDLRKVLDRVNNNDTDLSRKQKLEDDMRFAFMIESSLRNKDDTILNKEDNNESF